MKKYIKTIKCMAKNCSIIIEIKVQKIWYKDSTGKRIYNYGRETELSFCNIHNKQFKQALDEMKKLDPNFKIKLQEESKKEAINIMNIKLEDIKDIQKK